ncbi:MAG TPA: carbohydrate kinase [Cyanobacteria bacterium UBA11369]|nr:carbohydrate kinase [Cyanobacteria bacterium UBA11371]HBE34291.1 carbohydrate kinase [Cyanobacteria bacterium UBA11368]HBE52090.1 carbohydrate kinase [Cyanobacteria bacterium UBA11369]
MSNPLVLCLGEVLYDCLADQAGRSLDAVESWTPYPGGAPANVACALVKLGTSSGFIGCVGQDEAGNSLVELLQKIGVDTTGIQRHPKAPTRQVYVLRSLAGDRSFAGFGLSDTTEFADAFLQADQLRVELFERAEFLVLGTLELAYPETREAITRAIQLAEQYHLKILVDVNWRPMFWPDQFAATAQILELIQHVDFVKLSLEEAEWLFGTTNAKAIADRFDSLEGVLITDGDKGCAFCFSHENEGRLPAFPVKAEDTTGSGDGFVAGIIHQICLKGIQALSDPQAARRMVAYASAVGAMIAMKPGAIAAQPTADQVEEFLRSH